MKITIGLILLSIISCKKQNVTPVVENDEQVIIRIDGKKEKVYEWIYKGHTYIIINDRDDLAITHAGHCKSNH